MTLIERYLAAVAAHLPRDRREDIVAELDDALAERVEAREAELGRAMTEAETEALLREFGHPLTVAARYRGGPDHLIGPELFPYWWFAVKAALALLAVFVTVGAIGAAVVQGGDMGDVISEIISGLVNGGLTVVGIAALIGFALERQPNRPRFMTDWRVRDLELFRRWSLNGDDLGGGRFGERVAAMAAAPTRRLGGRTSPVARALWCVAGWTVFLLWWVGVFTPGGLSPQEMLAAAGSAFSGVDYSEALSGLADPLYWPVIVYGLARIGLELARMAAPGAVRPLAVGDLSLAGASAGILYWVWTQSSLAPVARIDGLGDVIERISALVHGRFDLGHLLVLILIINALEIAGRAIGALRRLATGRA
ncbi:MAG: hypothetical protein KF910_12210 [Brevundimonas sp.]|uniref:HAAS signaling domain-containing protein n=1 Tax=Brevundimonas sp. TaxID=1871086 RepID=UPI0025BD0BA5|nr:hypothetical protein [Brevundimonas sp.]MBX3478368.1 hypothetical protein [Brevundimonas sp.]